MQNILGNLWSRFLKSAVSENSAPKAPPNPESLTVQLQYASAREISEAFAHSICHGSERKESTWCDRAVTLVNSLTLPLVHLRDRQGQPLDIHAFRNRIDLREIEILCWSDTGGNLEFERSLAAIRDYLLKLPQYEKNLYDQGLRQKEDTQMHHAFICKQLTPTFDRELGSWD